MEEEKSAVIPFRLDGPAFDDGIPLHLMLNVLGEFHSIVDKTYLHFIDKERLSRFDRQHFSLKVPEIRKGSAEADIGLIITATQALMPFMQNVGPKGVWECTKETFSFLKVIYDASRRGKTPTYQNNVDGTINVTTGGESHTYNNCVFKIGKKTDQHYRKIAKSLDKTGADVVRFGKEGEDAIELLSIDSGRFDLKTTIDKEIKNIVCEIFDFNKFERTGLLQVHDDHDSIPADVYKFTVIGSQNIETYIESMLHHHVKVSCLRELLINPFEGESTVSLQILDVLPPEIEQGRVVNE